jgi:hypothetical protein
MTMIESLTAVAEGRAELARPCEDVTAYRMIGSPIDELGFRRFVLCFPGGEINDPAPMPSPQDLFVPWETLTLEQLRSEADE